jgi:hypothetical protein
LTKADDNGLEKRFGLAGRFGRIAGRQADRDIPAHALLDHAQGLLIERFNRADNLGLVLHEAATRSD